MDRNVGGQQLVALVKVALRKESVDRNAVVAPDHFSPGGRSPQGERG